MHCAKPAPANPVAEPAAVAAALSPLVPPKVGAFTATGDATTSTQPHRVELQRSYASGGKTLSVSLFTGDIAAERGILGSDAEHAFGSDTPTYWRTTSVRTFRTRIAEQRPTVRSSECYLAVGAVHVAFVRVAPARAGECAEVAALLDLETLARAPTVQSGAHR
ncbi:MAG: hypothetical protein HOO96_44180 [Polyangiaceae bacterium]|nr:hypothetical protein [Polyangiaceae bacterium]